MPTNSASRVGVPSYLAPTRTAEAFAFLREARAGIIAGCTDHFPRKRPGDDRNLLDITRLEGFRGIAASKDGWRIGAATTWTDVIRTPLPPAFDALKEAAREVGSVQIQNRGTVAGNICNASPAADGVPPLLILGAEVEILSEAGTRTEPLEEFITGPGKINLGPEEIVSAVLVPRAPGAGRSAFLKLGARTHLVISIVMVAACAEVRDGRTAAVALAAGSCSPTARRLPALESRLTGLEPNEIRSIDFAAHGALGPLAPISDARASADYRLDAVAELCRRAVLRALGEG